MEPKQNCRSTICLISMAIFSLILLNVVNADDQSTPPGMDKGIWVLKEKKPDFGTAEDTAAYFDNKVDISEYHVKGSLSWGDEKCSGSEWGTSSWSEIPAVLEPEVEQTTTLTAEVGGSQNCAYRHVSAWTALYVNDAKQGSEASVSYPTSDPKPDAVSLKVSWIAPWGKKGDTLTVTIAAHVPAALALKSYYNYIYAYEESGSKPDQSSLAEQSGSFVKPHPEQENEPPVPAQTGISEGTMPLPNGSDKESSLGDGEDKRTDIDSTSYCPPCRYGDSGVRFTDLSGQVDLRPDCNENAWKTAEIATIPCVDDHVRTGEESTAIMSFADMGTFVMKPESEVILDTPPQKKSKVKLVSGRIWENVKKMIIEGQMEVEMSQAVAGIKGTTIVCEENGGTSILKVLEGTASFRSKITGGEILVSAGEMATATENGLSQPQPFDVDSETASWAPLASRIKDTSTGMGTSESETVSSVSVEGLVSHEQSGSAQYADFNEPVRIRGQVATGDFTWDSQNFAGFYYDIDSNSGTESLSARVAEDSILSGRYPYGLTYQTAAQDRPFEFKDWGSYSVIGFLGKKCFAGYLESNDPDKNFLNQESQDKNSLAKGQIEEVLMDDDTERTITTANPLKLAGGYEIAVKSIDVDGNKVHVELTKNGQAVDSAGIQPSAANANMADKTYCYKTKIGDATNIVLIAVHFKNAFRGADANIATIDGVFQISDTAMSIKAGQAYDKMSISSVNDYSIAMDNRDNPITLSKNKDTLLMQNIYIKTADQKTITEARPLRFYVYKEYSEPGKYELRGAVHNLGEAAATWNPQSFAGFYYDINKDTGTETITFVPTGSDSASKILSDTQDPATGNSGAVYFTQAQQAIFKFKPWGEYDVIGFLADKYFAAYRDDVTEDMQNAGETVPFLADKSTNDNLMTNAQLSKVLMDDDSERTIATANPLILQEGYQLALKSTDAEGSNAYVELSRDGKVVDSKIIHPSMENAQMSDKTYYYKASIGDTKNIVQIAVHFKNAFPGAGTNLGTVDGIFQISDTPISIKHNTKYDKMSIREVDTSAMTIKMDNSEPITLSRNRDILLMRNIYIRTADQAITDANEPLRYYIYTTATLGSK